MAAEPLQDRCLKPLVFTGDLDKMVSEEICKLEAKSAIKPADPRPDQFISQIFLVPKKDGSQRPVINLKPLNFWITKQKFKMEGARVIRDLIKKDDWMVTIDLKDAYLSVPILHDHRKYLRFVWKGTT